VSLRSPSDIPGKVIYLPKSGVRRNPLVNEPLGEMSLMERLLNVGTIAVQRQIQ
jgi:hypothetical protein